jgi:SAM-dependent methyltransferase
VSRVAGLASPREQTSRRTHRVAAELLAAETRCRRVLDVPCGEGAFLARARALGHDAWGVDLERRLRVPDAPFVVADMNHSLPFARAAFDAVVSLDGIEHLERPFDFVRDCARVLRPEGVLILSTPNVSALRSRWRWMLTGFHNKGKTPLDETAPTPWHHVSLMGFPLLRYALHRNGFRITAIRANRVKLASWLYAPLWPVAALATAAAFQRWERDPAQRARNAEIRGQMLAPAVAFGETLILKAIRSTASAGRREASRSPEGGDTRGDTPPPSPGE